MSTLIKDNIYTGTEFTSFTPEVKLVEGPDPNLCCPMEGCNGWACVLVNKSTGEETKIICSNTVPHPTEGCKVKVIFSKFNSKCPTCAASIHDITLFTTSIRLK